MKECARRQINRRAEERKKKEKELLSFPFLSDYDVAVLIPLTADTHLSVVPHKEKI